MNNISASHSSVFQTPQNSYALQADDGVFINNAQSFSTVNLPVMKNTFTVTPSVHNKMGHSVNELAKAFLHLESMTHKKLQKLCYYAKAWHLALYDQNLINEDFQAWVHGAVQPDLYQRYKRYGFDNIPMTETLVDVPESFIDFASQVYDSYGDLTGDELEQLNHQERPWIEARQGLAPWQRCTNVISEESMKDYYRSLIKQ